MKMMKTTELLRSEADKLEEKIKLAIEEFIKEVGECEIRIDTDMHYVQLAIGKRQLVTGGVKVHITI